MRPRRSAAPWSGSTAWASVSPIWAVRSSVGKAAARSAAAGPPRRSRGGRRGRAARAAAAGATGSPRTQDTLRVRCPSRPRTPSRRPSASRRSATSSSCSRTTFDPAALSERRRALEEQMQAPGFWDDADAAAKLSAEHAKATRRLEEFTALERDVEDLDGLVELTEEDPDLEAELLEQLADVERR